MRWVNALDRGGVVQRADGSDRCFSKIEREQRVTGGPESIQLEGEVDHYQVIGYQGHGNGLLRWDHPLVTAFYSGTVVGAGIGWRHAFSIAYYPGDKE